MKLDFLLPIFSESELRYISDGWNVSHLENNESKAVVYENLKYLKECVTDTDNETILKYAVFYWGAFVNRVFKDRLNALIDRHDDWEEIVEKQFFAYDGFPISADDSAILLGVRFIQEQTIGPVDGTTPPIMQTIGWESDELFYEYLDLLDSPEKMHWSVLARLKKECGIAVEPEDIGFELMDFLDIEVLKNEILDSTIQLLQLGVNKDAMHTIIINSIHLLINGYNYVYEAFRNELGDDFVDKINELNKNETLEEVLCDLN